MKADPTELIVGLDVANKKRAMEMVAMLAGLPLVFKIGFELFVQEGPALVRALTKKGHRIFLDLKFHDIPNTVEKAVMSAMDMEVSYITLHLLGGSEMARKVMKIVRSASKSNLPRVLGITVLTSFDEQSWAEVGQLVSGTPDEVSASVSRLVAAAHRWGLDGVVCAAADLPSIRSQFQTLHFVTPGIRPAGSSRDDQRRVMTPADARAAGANAIVMGRPILQASDPRAVAVLVLRDLGHEPDA